MIPDPSLLKDMDASTVALILVIWMVGNWALKGYESFRATQQRKQIVESVKESPACLFPTDLAEGSRRALLLQERLAAEHSQEIGRLEQQGVRLEDAINNLVTAIDRRDTRQADTLQTLSNSIATLAGELRTLSDRRRSPR